MVCISINTAVSLLTEQKKSGLSSSINHDALTSALFRKEGATLVMSEVHNQYAMGHARWFIWVAGIRIPSSQLHDVRGCRGLNSPVRLKWRTIPS